MKIKNAWNRLLEEDDEDLTTEQKEKKRQQKRKKLKKKKKVPHGSYFRKRYPDYEDLLEEIDEY